MSLLGLLFREHPTVCKFSLSNCPSAGGDQQQSGPSPRVLHLIPALAVALSPRACSFHRFGQRILIKHTAHFRGLAVSTARFQLEAATSESMTGSRHMPLLGGWKAQEARQGRQGRERDLAPVQDPRLIPAEP
jgi:hypothetical protein